MPKRQLSSREILQDIRSGMDDTALMEKYGLSARELQEAFKKIIAAGELKQDELDSRGSAAERNINTTWKCPACEKEQPREFDECPVCGVVVKKLSAKAAPAIVGTVEPVMFGSTKFLWGAACLLLLGGALWVGLNYKTKIAEESRAEAARLEQLNRIEEQQRLQAKANERDEENRRDREAERQENELQRRQHEDMEAWREQEEERIQAEEKKQQQQESQQASKERRARLRVARAYLNMTKLTRDMFVSLLGEKVSRALPSLKSRAGEFQDQLLELKKTPGADPVVVDHFDKAFHHLMAAFSGLSLKEKNDSVRMWKKECRAAFAQIKASR
jgi:flagellar biosynthesis GTPase FlhF